MIKLKLNKLIVFSLFFLLTIFSHAQNSSFYKKSDTLNTKRKNAIILTESVMAGGALIALNQLWYQDYPR